MKYLIFIFLGLFAYLETSTCKDTIGQTLKQFIESKGSSTIPNALFDDAADHAISIAREHIQEHIKLGAHKLSFLHLSNVMLSGARRGQRYGHVIRTYDNHKFTLRLRISFPGILVASPYRARLLSGTLAVVGREVKAGVRVIDYKNKRFEPKLEFVHVGRLHLSFGNGIIQTIATGISNLVLPFFKGTIHKIIHNILQKEIETLHKQYKTKINKELF